MLAQNISFPVNAPIWALSFFGQWDKPQAAAAGPLSTCISSDIWRGFQDWQGWHLSEMGGGGSDGEAGLEEEGQTGPAVSCTFHLTLCQAFPHRGGAGIL